MGSEILGDLSSWVAAAVSIIAIVVAFKASKEASRLQQETTDLVAKQHKLELRSWTDQHFASVRIWAAEVCFAISEAVHIVEMQQDQNDRRLDVLVRLSALIDTGRWYFPNRWSDEYGIRKEPAYRGIRQEVLDQVVYAYSCVNGEVAGVCRENLIHAQRAFVSHIQAVLDPNKREEEISKILSEFEESDRLR